MTFDSPYVSVVVTSRDGAITTISDKWMTMFFVCVFGSLIFITCLAFCFQKMTKIMAGTKL